MDRRQHAGSRIRWWTASRPVTTADVVARDGRATSASTTSGRWWPSRSPQWVLEDDFSDGRPPFEDVGVLLVDDVTPYELMKLRLLNAGHQCLCYFAYLVRLPARARCRARPVVRRIPARATWIPRRRRRCRRCPGSTCPTTSDADRTFRQPRRARHRRAAVLRLVGPHPEMAASGDPRNLAPAGRFGCRQRRWPAGPATPRARRAGRTDRGPGPAGRLACSARPSQHETIPTAFIENTAVFGDLASQPASSRPTVGRWIRCTATGHARRWRP